MNVVAMIGNVASEPVRTERDGVTVCTFRLAVSRNGDEADFFTVESRARQAEVVHEYVTVGRRVSVEGRMRSTADGLIIVAHRVQLLGRPVPEPQTAVLRLPGMPEAGPYPIVAGEEA